MKLHPRLREVVRHVGVVTAGLKKFSNWPTFPQLYVSGEMLGGVDIIKVG